MKRPSHCIGPCGRALVSANHVGPRPDGHVSHGGRGMCDACYKASGAQFPATVLPDRSLPYAVWLPPSWTEDALCAQTDADAFYPEKGGYTEDAKAVCAACPVRAACLDYALDNRERFGVWGGASERERRAMLKARDAA